MPSGAGHDEIVIDTGLADNRILLVREPIDPIKVAIVPKDTTSWRTNRRVATTSGDISLLEREWGRAVGHKHNQVKRASDRMRFNRGANLRFHFARALVE